MLWTDRERWIDVFGNYSIQSWKISAMIKVSKRPENLQTVKRKSDVATSLRMSVCNPYSMSGVTTPHGSSRGLLRTSRGPVVPGQEYSGKHSDHDLSKGGNRDNDTHAH